MTDKQRSILMFVVCAFSAFLATFNETFLNVGFSNIALSLGVDFNTVQWLATAYMLGAAVMVPVSAFLYRKVPTKLLFLLTVLCFVVGSLVCVLSNTFVVLLVGRIIQALGSGLLVPMAMNITLEVAPREKLGTYMGVMGAMTTLGPSVSIILAGVVLSVCDWHVLFYVFGGLSILLFVLGALFVDNVAKLTKPKLDVLSVVLISISLIGILYAISSVFSCWWLALVMFAVGMVCLVLFCIRQNRIPEPLINLSPLKVKPFAVGVVLNILGLVIVFAMNILLPQYMQSVLGAEPLTASLTLFPATLLACVVAPFAGKIFDRHGAKGLLLTGFSVMAVFLLLLSLFVDSQYWVIALCYVLVIVGSALIIGPVQSFALSFLQPQQNPHGVTILSTGFQIAGCIGSSLFASVYAFAMSSFVADGAVLNNPNAHYAFWIVGALAVLLSILGLVLSVVVTRKKKKLALNQTKTTPQTTLADIMKKDVYTISLDATILDAMQLFLTKRISGAPVVDLQGKFAGFLSDGDIIRYLATNHSSIKFAYAYAVTDGQNDQPDAQLKTLAQLKVGDIAVKDAVVVGINLPIGEVCRLLTTKHVKKAPVMQNGEMVGIVNRSDITKYAMQACIDNYTDLPTQTKQDFANRS